MSRLLSSRILHGAVLMASLAGGASAADTSSTDTGSTTTSATGTTTSTPPAASTPGARSPDIGMPGPSTSNPVSASSPASASNPATEPISPVALSPEQVRILQRSLSQHGMQVNVSGAFDDSTRTALLEFQKSRALPGSGALDKPTLDALGIDPRDVTPVRGSDELKGQGEKRKVEVERQRRDEPARTDKEGKSADKPEGKEGKAQ